MANEISLNQRLSLANGLVVDPGPNMGAQRINQNNALLWKRTILLTAETDTNISALIAGLTTVGICYFYNLDPTNYVQWGGDTGAGAIAVIGKMLPAPLVNGSPDPDIVPMFRLDSGGMLRMKAHTGNCEVLVCVYDD